LENHKRGSSEENPECSEPKGTQLEGGTRRTARTDRVFEGEVKERGLNGDERSSNVTSDREGLEGQAYSAEDQGGKQGMPSDLPLGRESEREQHLGADRKPATLNSPPTP